MTHVTILIFCFSNHALEHKVYGGGGRWHGGEGRNFNENNTKREVRRIELNSWLYQQLLFSPISSHPQFLQF